jgi:RNase H-fold protein (predicted Holliday junction resolvase)
MRILGIDWGKKKIGLAVANSISKNINPIGVFSNNHQIFYKIREFILKYDIKKIVIGKPVFTKTYQEAPIFNEIQNFSNNLFNFLKENNILIEINYVNEEYSTFLACDLINYVNSKNEKIKSKIKRRLKERIDGLSAVWILKSYINA